jgi:hypothetical protein
MRGMVRLAGVLATAVAALAVVTPAHAAPPPETVAARQHFFGAENVAPDGTVRADRVILSWFSVASVAAAIDGHVVLLDAYIHKEENRPNYVPTTREELVALAPEAIFTGHGHFDHAGIAGEIIARTGAFLVGTPEHCDQAKQLAADYAGEAVDVRCIDAVSRGSEPGAEVNEFRPFADRLEVTALKHVHSAAEAPDGENHETTLTSAPIPDARLVLLHPPGPSALEHLTTSGDEGSSVLYQFRLGSFSLVWNDTAGPLRERAPHVLSMLEQLPATDVEVGSVLGFNDPTNGLRDIVDYVDRMRPTVFYPVHHDFVAEYGASLRMKGVMEREMAKRANPPPTELRWLYDPADYLRPGLMTFDPDADRWGGPACMRERLRIRRRGVGIVRLGEAATALATRSEARSTSRRTLGFCVGEPSNHAVSAVSDEDGAVRLVASTARAHRTRGVGAGSSRAAVRRSRPRAVSLGHGLLRASRNSPIVFVSRRARVRLAAVADQALIAHPAKLRRYLSRASGTAAK